MNYMEVIGLKGEGPASQLSILIPHAVEVPKAAVVCLYCERNPGDIDTEMPYSFNNSETFFFHCCVLGFSGQELTREIGNWSILAIFICLLHQFLH